MVDVMNLINNNDLFLLEEIVKKNFAAKYKDSVLGIFWTILRPLLMMILFTILFSTIFGRGVAHYPVYFLCGRCIFDFFNNSIYISMNSINGNRSILKRTAAPKYIFVLGGILSEFINFLITVIILICVMIVTNTPFYFTIMPFSVIPIISLSIMITGLGFMLSIICVYYTDIQHLWSVVSMMIMYASALFYPMDIIPEPYHHYLILNPIYWFIDQFRCFMYQGTIPSTLNMINGFLLALIIFVMGVIVFKKFEKRVAMKF